MRRLCRRHGGGRRASPQLYHLDATRPEAPRARLVAEEVARTVRARAANPCWADGMMRHGFRGGAEIAATLDHLAAFAHLTRASCRRICSTFTTRPRWAGPIWWISWRARTRRRLAALRDRFAALARRGCGHPAQLDCGADGGGGMTTPAKQTPVIHGPIKGWCPGALAADAVGRRAGGAGAPARRAADARAGAGHVRRWPRAHGNGLIDLFRPRQPAVARRDRGGPSRPDRRALRALGLIDDERRDRGAAQHRGHAVLDCRRRRRPSRLADLLAQALAAPRCCPPGKFGFAVDTGAAPVLRGVSADIRIERGPAAA